MTLRAKIAGTGMYVPERVVSNDDLALLMDTSDEWIQQRSGIVTRRHVAPGQQPSELAEQASRRALEAAGCQASEIDCILLATLSAEAEFPGTSYFLQARLEIGEVPCFDLRAQCSGFVYALSVANSFVRAGTYERVLVVGCEVHSTGLDYSTEGRDVTVLFGDGAGAAVISATEVQDDSPASRESFILSTHLHSDGGLLGHLLWAHPGTANPQFLTQSLMDEPESYPQMRGRELKVICLERMPEVTFEALNAHGYKPDDVDLYVIHQSNKLINEAYAEAMRVPQEKVFSTIEDFGNTTAATIPIGLSEAVRRGRLKRGMLVASCSFGSGITWASALYRW